MHKNITSRTYSDLVEEFLPLAEKMRAEGVDQLQIDRAFKSFLTCKRQNLKKEKPVMRSIGQVLDIRRLMDEFGHGRADADSNAEKDLYDLLVKNSIPFSFHYPIGPYTADFLVERILVLELDGPSHNHRAAHDSRRNDYIIGKGFDLLRVPVITLQTEPMKLIGEIRERVA
jgi:very-short-patch-repair endonuclease